MSEQRRTYRNRRMYFLQCRWDPVTLPGNASLSITEQLREGKDAIRKKRPVRKLYRLFSSVYKHLRSCRSS